MAFPQLGKVNSSRGFTTVIKLVFAMISSQMLRHTPAPVPVTRSASYSLIADGRAQLEWVATLTGPCTAVPQSRDSVSTGFCFERVVEQLPTVAC